MDSSFSLSFWALLFVSFGCFCIKLHLHVGGSLLATPLYIPNALPVPAQASCPLITVGANQTQTNAQTVKDRAKVRVRERGRKGDRKWEIDRRGRWRVGASLLSVGSCKNCCILSDGGCVVACRAYFSAAWPSA